MNDNPLCDSPYPADIMNNISYVLDYLIETSGQECRAEWRLSGDALVGQQLVFDWLRRAALGAASKL